MSMFDNWRNKLGIESGRESDGYVDDTEDEIYSAGQGGAVSGYDPIETEPRDKAISINATTVLQLVVVKPERFEDAGNIANQLLDKRTVVLNMESTNKDEARRLIDFLAGVAYSLNGQIKKVARNTFIISHYGVNISQELVNELENNDVRF